MVALPAPSGVVIEDVPSGLSPSRVEAVNGRKSRERKFGIVAVPMRMVIMKEWLFRYLFYFFEEEDAIGGFVWWV